MRSSAAQSFHRVALATVLAAVAIPLLAQDKPDTRPAPPHVELPKSTAAQAPGQSADAIEVTIFHVDAMTLACARHDVGNCVDILHWRYQLKDRTYTSTATENQGFTEALQKLSGWKPGEKLSDKLVTLRGEAHAPFSLVSAAMTACATAGIGKIEIATVSKVSGKPGAIPTPLPTDAGEGVAPLEVRVSITRDPKTNEIRRAVANDVIPPGEGSDAALTKALQAPRDAAKSRPLVVLIAAAESIPWTEVVRVLDVLRSLGIEKVEFAIAPSAPPIPESRRPK